MIVVFSITLLGILIVQTQCFIEYGSYTNFAQNIIKLLENEQVLLSSNCSDHLLKYANDLLNGEFWALKMFDSNAKLPPGLLKSELGSFDECLDVVGPINKTDSIFGKYCIGTIPLNLHSIPTVEELRKALKNVLNIVPNGKQSIKLAICIPHSCSAKELMDLYGNLSFRMNFYEESCQSKITRDKFDQLAIAGIAFFGLVVGVMVLSTIYDAVLHYMQKSPRRSLLIAFSILRNGKNLITLSENHSQITCLHGIRVITTIWIIYYHTRQIENSFSTNYFDDGNWYKKEASMYVLNVGFAVDTFFVMGGLLVSYNYLTAVKRGIKFNIVLHYVHRYLRLTWVVIAIIVFNVTILRYIGSGPLWPTIEETEVARCKNYWWKALLYVQNYGPQSTGLCITTSWYLSAEFQLYLLSPILLISLRKWHKIALISAGFLIACSSLSAFLVGWIFELGIVALANPTPLQVSQYIQYYYYFTPVRAASWLIGFILGDIIFKLKESKKKFYINKVVLRSLWTVSIGTMCACAFAGRNLTVQYNKIESSLHMAFVKPAWAIGISWVIFGCFSGNGGPINWFLALPVFEVLSKLTYTLYLVHFGVISVIRAQIRETVTHKELQTIHSFWGDYVFSLAASLFLVLAFELPMITVEKVLLSRWTEKAVTQTDLKPAPGSESTGKLA